MSEKHNPQTDSPPPRDHTPTYLHPIPDAETGAAENPAPETIRDLLWFIEQTTGIQYVCVTWITQKVISSNASDFPSSIIKPLRMLWPWHFIFSIYMELTRLCMLIEGTNPENTEPERNKAVMLVDWLRVYQFQNLGQYGVGCVIMEPIHNMIDGAVPIWLEYIIYFAAAIAMICGLLVPMYVGDSFFLNTGYKRLLLHANSGIKAAIVGLCLGKGGVGRV